MTASAAMTASVLLALAPATLDAQRGAPREAVINFGREYDTGDGYVNASVRVRYQFADCVGDIAVLYAMDRESIWTASTYYYRGKSYEVPSSIGRPRPETVVFQGPILDNVGRHQGSFSDPYTQGGAGAGCIGQSKVVFTRKAKLGEGSTREQYEAYLQTLWIRPTTQPRMRDGRVESWIGEQLAKQRDDSLQRVAERDKRDRDARARRDSLDREQRLADERRQRAADSTRAVRDREAQDDRGREEAEERARDREQAERDRQQEIENKRMVDAQTERLNAMFAVEKLEWERAEDAYARGDLATARPLYEKLAGSLVYGDRAQARLDSLNQQQMAEGVAATFQLMGAAWNGLKHLNETIRGSGLTAGATYAQYGFPGAEPDAGIMFSYVARPMQRWVPYADFTWGLGNDESKAVRYYPNKSFGAIVLGTTVPKLKLPLGSRASLSPHFGWRYVTTDEEELNLGQTGLLLIVPGMLVRGDVIMIDGKPQFGAALARIF